MKGLLILSLFETHTLVLKRKINLHPTSSRYDQNLFWDIQQHTPRVSCGGYGISNIIIACIQDCSGLKVLQHVGHKHLLRVEIYLHILIPPQIILSKSPTRKLNFNTYFHIACNFFTNRHPIHIDSPDFIIFISSKHDETLLDSRPY